MTENPMLESIYSRRSIRKYKDQDLSKEQVDALVKAALLSPSSMNMQPWHLTVLRDQDLISDWEKDIIQHFLDLGNKKIIAHNESRNNKIFYDAPLVFVISMEEGKEMDVGIMAQGIALAAKAMGLDSVILGFPRASFEPKYKDKWKKALKLPDNYVYGIAVAVGYGDEAGRDREPDMSKVSFID